MTQAPRASPGPDVQSAEVQRSIETLAAQTPFDVRTFHLCARDNIRGSAVGIALRRCCGGLRETALPDRSLPGMTDLFAAADLVG